MIKTIMLAVALTVASVPAWASCGIASHYGKGDGLHGRKTASGKRFNAYGYTAAHRSLPFGTRLTVTNPRSGRSVAVVINDRGPFVRGRSLDLSYVAARAIGINGIGKVCWK